MILSKREYREEKIDFSLLTRLPRNADYSGRIENCRNTVLSMSQTDSEPQDLSANTIDEFAKNGSKMRTVRYEHVVFASIPSFS